ncbi:carbohydrate porin [Roseomonas sp. BN140053]|uniref:carbohydrate porin n=1 Tax=Roseomonas sp. BN140053 TaxID=3391898 RepID=UPI0039E85C35
MTTPVSRHAADGRPHPGGVAARLGALALLGGLAAPPVRAQEAPPRGEPTCDEGVGIAAGTCLSGEALVDGFANLRGGVHRGVAAFTQFKLGLGVDLGAQAEALQGWSFQASGFGIYGRQPTPTLTGSFAPLSNAEALSSLRLSELWLERGFGDYGSVRFGQLAADAEFFTAAAAGGLTNGTFGWPLAASTALPSGGPAYPFAAPGVRVALGDPDEAGGLRLGVFSGDPGGHYGDGTDPQRHNRYGVNFSLAGGALFLAEAVTGASAPVGSDGPQPWVAKLGGWFHNGGFDDQRRAAFDVNSDPLSSGLLADPGGSGTPFRRNNNHGVYGVGEVTLWRGGGGSIAAFARASWTPPSRNLLGFYADGGLAWRGPFGRRGDTLSLGVAYARASGEGRRYDRDRDRLADAGVPLRNRETVLEADYEFQLVPDTLFLRPLVQWISQPAANIPDARYRRDAGLRDVVVLGLRVRATL